MSLHTIFLILHVLGAGLLVGVVFFSLVLSIKKPLDIARLKIIKYVGNFGVYAAVWLLLTGAVLFWNEHQEFQAKRLFWIKMVLFVVDGIIAERLIRTKVESAIASNNPESVSKSLPVWTYASALVIILIVSFGVLIATPE